MGLGYFVYVKSNDDEFSSATDGLMSVVGGMFIMFHVIAALVCIYMVIKNANTVAGVIFAISLIGTIATLILFATLPSVKKLEKTFKDRAIIWANSSAFMISLFSLIASGAYKLFYA